MKLILALGATFLFSACALLDDQAPKKPASTGLIATPASYYSTAKAKYLAAKYKENLDRIVERIVRNPKTSALQFANNISSVGGIGFFTHSATKFPDERYLEVVLATPETFESKIDVSAKVQQLFTRYGAELLGIVSGDADIYRDKELNGYGLNLAWRNVVAEVSGNRIALARAIIYLPKERVLSFLRNEVNQNDLLAEAVIFAVDEDGPLNLVSYKPQTLRPEFRPTIREDDLTSSPVAAMQPAAQPAAPAREEKQKTEEKRKVERSIEVAKNEAPSAAPAAKTLPQENKAEAKKVPVSAQKSVEKPALPNKAAAEAHQQSAPALRKGAEGVASTGEIKRGSLGEMPSNKPGAEVASDPPKAAVEAPERADSPGVTTPPPEAVAQKPTQKAIPTPVPLSESKVAAAKLEEAASEAIPAATPKPIVSAEKVPTSSKPAAETIRRAPIVAGAPKIPAALPKAETKSIVEPGDVVARAAEKQPIIEQKQEDENAAAVGPAPVSKPAVPAVSRRSDTTASQAQSEKIPLAQAGKPKKPLPPVEKAAELRPPVGSNASVAKAAATPAPVPTQPEPIKVTMEEKLESVQAPQSAAARPAEIAQEKSKTKSGDAAPIQAPVAQSPMPRTPPEQIKAGPPASLAKSERPPVEPDPASPSVAAIPKAMISEESKNERLALNKPSESPAEKISPRAKPAIQTVPLEPVKRAPMSGPPKAIPAPGADRAEARPVEMKPAVPAAIAKENEKAADKAAGEQVALLSKPKEPVIERKPAVIPPVQKALEGFIIQLAFNEREKARHWAEALQRRGYAVSLTEAGVDGALRVRLGNFAVREEAERQLRNLKQDGLTGIIINLPQAFRPEARSSVP